MLRKSRSILVARRMIHAGFTLVEVMMSIAIGSIVIMAGYSLLQSQREGQWRSENKSTVNDDREEIAMLARRRLPRIVTKITDFRGLTNATGTDCANGDTSCTKIFDAPTLGESIKIDVKCESTSSDKLLNSLDFTAKGAVSVATTCIDCAAGTRPRVTLSIVSNGKTKVQKYPRLDIGASGPEGKYSGGVAANLCIAPPAAGESWTLELIQFYFSAPPSSSWKHQGQNYLEAKHVIMAVDAPAQLGNGIQLMAPK